MNKMRVKQCLALYALLLYSSTGIWGQSQDQYIRTMNSTVSTTPEATGLMKYIDFPVNLFNGKPNISIPLCSVNGKSLSVPISIAYTASNGVKINDMAGNVGLGFLLMCGGEITREVRGKPDEGCCGAVGLLQNAHHPISFYYNDPSTSPTYMQQAAQGLLDLEPDMFYFSVAGANGKFIYDEETSSFICTKLEPYKVTYDLPNNKWQIVGPDGNIYLFEKTVTTSTQTSCFPGMTPTTGYPITTSWKCTKMYNADKTDSIMIEYDYNTYYYYSEGSSTKYLLETTDGATTGRSSMDCFNKNTINGFDHILSISSSTDTVKFQYATDVRQDLGQAQNALAYITYSNGDASAKKIFGMSYDYYIRNTVVGIYSTIQNSSENTRSLRLNQITNYGNSLSNANPLKWIFAYNSMPLPSRLSYSQDFWGYYNNRQNTNTLAPSQVLVSNDGNASYSDGADRYADPDYMQAGVLTKIQFPTGGTTSFEYEPNTTGVPTDLARPAAYLPIGNTIVQGNLPPASPYGNQSKTFVVNVSHNPTAGMQDGVVATISCNPVTPGTNWNAGTSYFSLAKTSSGGIGFSRFFGHNGVETVFLPNGTYTMSVINNGMVAPPVNTGDGGAATLGVDFDIAYNIPDTTHIVNYVLGGLRIKSIVSQDQYTNVTSKKEYSYQDPVTDSSYGVFTGSNIHLNHDYLRTNQTLFPSGGYNNTACQLVTYLARHGNCIMPVGNSLGSTVVYPIVTEFTDEGNKRYKTEYHYNYTQPMYSDGYPYVPPLTHESGDGRLLSSTAYQTVNANTFWPAKTIKNQYNFTPATQASNGVVGFRKLISGMRVGYAGYTEDVISCGFDYDYNNFYTTEINRSDLTSDSIITYDLHNQYNSINEWEDYVYGDYNQQPIIIRSGNSDGSIIRKENYFPIDFPSGYTLPSAAFASNLQTFNRVNQLLGTKSYKDNELLSQQQSYGHFNLNDTKLLIDSTQDAMFSNPLQTEIKILAYDNAANPIQMELRGSRFKKFILKKNLPIASCASSNKDDYFFFTSFEYPGDGGVVGASFSGKSGYHLSASAPYTISTPPLNNTDVYFWAGATNGTISILVNGVAAVPTGRTSSNNGPWVLYKAHVSGGATQVSLTTNNAVFTMVLDQLVVIPTDCQFQGTVYDASNRVIATVNDQIETNFFEYDSFGRLSIVRDEQSNILKSTNYQYQAAQ